MAQLALTRAAHLHDYLSVLRDLGAPVDRNLAQSRLPQCIEETPELYVSVPMATEWIARTGHDLEPMALGLLGTHNASLSNFQPLHQTAILTAPTGLSRLRAVAAIAAS